MVAITAGVRLMPLLLMTDAFNPTRAKAVLLPCHRPLTRRRPQEIKIDAYFGRKVAVDASMSIYQFLIAMQRPDGSNMLTNDAGEVTSHITGRMYRTTKMLEVGIKPLYVFDGKAPDLKRGTLDDRKEKREEADAALAKAKEDGDQEAIEKVRDGVIPANHLRRMCERRLAHRQRRSRVASRRAETAL